MNPKRGTIILFSIVLAVIFSLCVVPVFAAPCDDLSSGTEFGAANDGEEVILCTDTYTGVDIADVPTSFTLDCNGSTLIEGAGVVNSSGVKIQNCIFTTSDIGLTVTDSADLTLDSNVFENAATGASLQGVLRGSIRYTNFSGAAQGLAITDSMYLAISTHNRFEGNQIGLLINNSVGSQIYKNIFIKSIDVDAVSARVIGNSSVNNTWDYLGEGNYWSDYAGEDVNNNGIGDTPHVISSEAGENQDNAPFMGEDLTKIDKPDANIIAELTSRTGEYLFTVGDAIKFTCGANDTYVLLLSSILPELSVYLNDDRASLAGYAPNTLDLDGDGVVDVNVAVMGYSKDDVNVKVVLLDSCYYYCGDAVCTAGEDNSTCLEDCRPGQASADDDGDGWTLTAGDCDDTKANIFPGAEEQCSLETDYDCDGLRGEEDTDCQGMGFGFWFWIVLAGLLAGAAAFFYFWKRAPGGLGGESGAESGGRGDGSGETASKPTTDMRRPSSSTPRGELPHKIQKIIDYAEDYFAKGETTAQVRETLLVQGWSEKDINAALRAMGK